jgi:DNA-binding GntR family transcriptional regulator
LTAVTGRPAYRRVADDLRAKILDGTHPVGEPLPSTAKLMAAYDVSITVARAAVNELRVEGVVAGQPGKGVYVIEEPAAPGPDLGTLVRTVEDMGKSIERLEKRVSELEKRRP